MTTSDRLKVLVVEDEGLIRLDAIEFLQDAGFEVFEAENADAALTVMDRVDGIRVVFTDVNMPGALDGMQMSHRIADIRPEVGIVIASGKMRPSSAELPEGALFITKSYDFKTVIRSIQLVSSR